jgi:alkanesulfonate monooxygenase SsuD/methylene tetrahydromethanopterin reductase-like flavin-dependent oxidoreductase (luciferase family)
VPFPPVAERFERHEETLQIVRQMCSDDVGPYQGQHYRLSATLNSPQPLRRPRPPIMIGGGEKTLRLVARYADATNLLAGPNAGPDVVKAKFDVLRQHCAREGTDYDRIRKTVLYVGALEPDATGGRAFAEQMARYAGVGVEEVHVMPYGPDPVGFVRGLSSHVIPAVESL